MENMNWVEWFCKTENPSKYMNQIITRKKAMNWSNHGFYSDSSGLRRRRRINSDEKITGAEMGQHWFLAGDNSGASASIDAHPDRAECERAVDPFFIALEESLPRITLSGSTAANEESPAAVGYKGVPFSKALLDCSSEVISILAPNKGIDTKSEAYMKPSAAGRAFNLFSTDHDRNDDEFLEEEFGETLVGMQGAPGNPFQLSNSHSAQGSATSAKERSPSAHPINSCLGQSSIQQHSAAKEIATSPHRMTIDKTQSPAVTRPKRTRDASIMDGRDNDLKMSFSDKQKIVDHSSRDVGGRAVKGVGQIRQDAKAARGTWLERLPDEFDDLEEDSSGKEASVTKGAMNESSRHGAGKKQQEQWMERYQQLLEYRAEHGHANVPFSYKGHPALAQWIKRQRYQYKCMSKGKHSHLTPERVELLESIGFAWDSHAHAFEENFEKLVEFKQKTGHCMVPTREQRLFAWCKRQRRQYRCWLANRQSTLTEDRVQRLSNLGFQWTIEQEQEKREGKG